MSQKTPARKLLVAVMGPTASGKTNFSIALARHFATGIISVDARQMYREMDIGTAKPTKEELALAKHHFIDNLSIREGYNASHFAEEVAQALEVLFKKYDVVVASGGSTLYYRAWLHGLDEMPEVPSEVRERVRVLYEEKGLPALQEEARKLDPSYFSLADTQNPRRLMRALEVCLASGKPYSSFLRKKESTKDYDIIKIGMDVERENLYARINARCDRMLEEGLLEEVKKLYPYKHQAALQTVGYREFFDWMEGKTSFEEAVDLFKKNTRNYAKRQLTWLRKEQDLHWLSPNDIPGAIRLIERKLRR